MSSSDTPRVRREHQSEHHIGKFVGEAAAEADNRVFRNAGGPPLTDLEKELLAASPREPVQLYARVVVTDLELGEQERYRLVREGEGTLESGEISVSTPIGRALYGEYPGAVVTVKTPGGNRLYRLLQVHS